MQNDLYEIKRDLRDRIEDLARDLLGSPNKQLSGRGELRWGQNGSLALVLKGAKRGSWFDHEAGSGGGPFELIMRERGIPFSEALVWAREWLGRPSESAYRPPVKPQTQTDQEDDTTAKRARALRVWNAAVPVSGTPAEAYLRNRGIAAEKWPDQLRWAPESKQLLVALTRPDGSFAALQRISLKSDGTPLFDNDGKKIKRSLGPIKGAAAKFGVGADGPIILAEGPETALSLWFATGLETWAVCGVIGQADLSGVPFDRLIIACPDDDPREGAALMHATKAIRRWQREGRKVVTATPFAELKRTKADFNDALMELGPDHVRTRIHLSISGQEEVPPKALPVEQARAVLGAIMQQIFTDAPGTKANG